MSPEEEFELWWKKKISYGYDVPELAGMKLCCKAAYLAGRKLGLEEANFIAETAYPDSDAEHMKSGIMSAIRQRIEQKP